MTLAACDPYPSSLYVRDCEGRREGGGGQRGREIQRGVRTASARLVSVVGRESEEQAESGRERERGRERARERRQRCGAIYKWERRADGGRHFSRAWMATSPSPSHGAARAAAAATIVSVACMNTRECRVAKGRERETANKCARTLSRMVRAPGAGPVSRFGCFAYLTPHTEKLRLTLTLTSSFSPFRSCSHASHSLLHRQPMHVFSRYSLFHYGSNATGAQTAIAIWA